MNLAEQSKQQKISHKSGKNWEAIHAGKFSDLLQYELQHPIAPRKSRGKLFLKDHLNLNGMQVSINKLPAGVEVPFYHQHKENEELYIFIGGHGQMQIDGEQINVEEGTCIRVAPAGERTWRNNSSTDLYYIVIQAKENSLNIDTFDDGIPGDRPVSW